MQVKVSAHLAQLAKTSPAVQRQFFPFSNQKQAPISCDSLDPLLEDEHLVVKGLIRKYANRALVLLTLRCASYCQFCTRQRLIKDTPEEDLDFADLDQIITYLTDHPGIREVIISGGDPLVVPEKLLYILKKLAELDSIKVIRIGTRLPVSDPDSFPEQLSTVIQQMDKPVYVMLNVEHPDELTEPTIRVIRQLRKSGALLFSQSVFLRNVNDEVDILEKLFSQLIEHGVKPYYLFRCDEVKGIEHFIVDFDKEVAIMTELRKRLSGLAYPLYVIDSPKGLGKIPAPLNFWAFDHAFYTDFSDRQNQLK